MSQEGWPLWVQCPHRLLRRTAVAFISIYQALQRVISSSYFKYFLRVAAFLGAQVASSVPMVVWCGGGSGGIRCSCGVHCLFLRPLLVLGVTSPLCPWQCAGSPRDKDAEHSWALRDLWDFVTCKIRFLQVQARAGPGESAGIGGVIRSAIVADGGVCHRARRSGDPWQGYPILMAVGGAGGCAAGASAWGEAQVLRPDGGCDELITSVGRLVLRQINYLRLYTEAHDAGLTPVSCSLHNRRSSLSSVGLRRAMLVKKLAGPGVGSASLAVRLLSPVSWSCFSRGLAMFLIPVTAFSQAPSKT